MEIQAEAETGTGVDSKLLAHRREWLRPGQATSSSHEIRHQEQVTLSWLRPQGSPIQSVRSQRSRVRTDGWTGQDQNGAADPRQVEPSETHDGINENTACVCARVCL